MNKPTERLSIVATTMESWADLLQSGTTAEQETAFALRVLIASIYNGYSAELETHLGLLADTWLDRSVVIKEG